MTESEHPLERIKNSKSFDEEFGDWFASHDSSATPQDKEKYVKRVREKIDKRMREVAAGWSSDEGG